MDFLYYFQYLRLKTEKKALEVDYDSTSSKKNYRESDIEIKRSNLIYGSSLIKAIQT